MINNNNRQQFNQIDWDADYDGENANISLTSNTDGNKNHFDIRLDNEDLANMISIPSTNIPIDKRLQMDFDTSSFRQEPMFFRIEMPNIKTPHRSPSYLPEISKPNSYLSSPLPDEELIVPISIGENFIDKTSYKKRHKIPKTHKTYKVYKKLKSHSMRKKSNSKSKVNRVRKNKLKSPSIHSL
jgi:hypothetical protein